MIDKIKKIPEKLNLIKALIFVICITVYCVLTAVSSALTGSLPSQTAAKRFAPDDDYAQATAFIEQTHALPADMMAYSDTNWVRSLKTEPLKMTRSRADPTYMLTARRQAA